MLLAPVNSAAQSVALEEQLSKENVPVARTCTGRWRPPLVARRSQLICRMLRQALGKRFFASVLDYGAIVLTQKHPETGSIHSAGPEQVGKRFRWNVRDAQVP